MTDRMLGLVIHMPPQARKDGAGAPMRVGITNPSSAEQLLDKLNETAEPDALVRRAARGTILEVVDITTGEVVGRLRSTDLQVEFPLDGVVSAVVRVPNLKIVDQEED